MSSMIGMDSGQIRALATSLRGQANALSTVISNLDGVVHQMSQSWNGSDAAEFVDWWQRQHRPALASIQNAVAGLAQSADNNATQQDTASSSAMVSSGTGLAGVGKGIFSATTDISNRFGFVVGPLLSDLPKVGGPIGALMLVDQGVRLAQDIANHDPQGAYEQASDITSGTLMGTHTPTGFLAGTTVIIAKHAEQAYRQVDWNYTYHHLDALNPFAPGAIQAIGQAEAQGLTSLGVDWFQQAVSAALTK